MDDQHEEVERIPWGELLAATEDGRRRLVYLAAAAVGVLALAVVVTRALSSPSKPPSTSVGVVETTVTTGDPIETAPQTAATTSTAPPPAPTTTVAAIAPDPVLYSEADLMAFPPDLGARAAVTRAEWFVTDYFTADLEPNGTADVRSALPGGSDLPVMPQDEATGLSYVEWARAYEVESIGDGRYLVGVAYRLLGAPPESGFLRLPVRAVEVVVEVSEAGGTVVADLPSPAALPAGPPADPWPEAAEEVPQEVVDGAIAEAAGWGVEHRFLAAGRITGGWRVVLTAADEVGNRWPVVVRVEDGGSSLEGR